MILLKAKTLRVEGEKEILKSKIGTTVISDVYMQKEANNHNPCAKKDSTAKGNIVPVPSKLNKPISWTMVSPKNNIRVSNHTQFWNDMEFN